MLLHEVLEVSHVHAVVHVGIEFQSRSQKELITHACVVDEFLVLHIIVRQSGELSSLPGEMADVEGVMQGTKEEESVHDDRPLVDVPQLGGVGSIYHNYLIII